MLDREGDAEQDRLAEEGLGHQSAGDRPEAQARETVEVGGHRGKEGHPVGEQRERHQAPGQGEEPGADGQVAARGFAPARNDPPRADGDRQVEEEAASPSALPRGGL